MQYETIELNDREIFQIPDHPSFPSYVRHIGVSLDNEEAQKFIKESYRVFCDEGGPYLVLRVPRKFRGNLYVVDTKHTDIKFTPIPWSVSYMSGVVCWLAHAI